MGRRRGSPLLEPFSRKRDAIGPLAGDLRGPSPHLKDLRTNNQIRVPKLKVIDDQGTQLGEMATIDALRLAKERELDLVEVGPTVNPPIAKIMDYGKYKYQKERQEKKSGSKPKEHELKTVRVGFKTGIHDLTFKASQVDGFLKEGHIVKIELTLRGREKSLAQMGRDKLIKFLEVLSEPFVTQNPIQRGPFGWTTLIQKDKKIK